MDLFPIEQPYVVAKIEDANGYSLSNQSFVGDFIQSGMSVFAIPEKLVDPSKTSKNEIQIHAGQNTLELV